MTIAWIGTIAVTLCCFVVAVKCVWTFGLPYAMLLSVVERGWSIFQLVEFVPLLCAVLISWAIGLTGWFTPKSIAVTGTVLIVSSYVHFVVILMVVGYVRSRRKLQSLSDTQP